MVSQAHSSTKANDQKQMSDTKNSDEIRSVAGAPIVCLDLVDSTNAEALRIARRGERGPLWIIAKEQSVGRGRRGATWVSAAGNLHATLMLTDPASPAVAPQLGFVVGYARHGWSV